ncbi:Sporulation kinase E [Pontiella desulfatans]|uniref:Sporulation kinase E n=2 Tax=Pontiella desulfatans TaxID=2750659 RepID=A0A6C2UAZ1_PONDE|nr:Sporulation kinase E [Pontiella desulfatans]
MKFGKTGNATVIPSADLGARQGILAEFYEYAPAGYLILDFDGRILEANATAGTLLGMELAAQLKGQAFSGFVHAESAEAWEAHRNHVVERGEKHGVDLVLQPVDGKRIVARAECTPRPASGLCLMVLVDITQRVWVEDALRKSEQELAMINLGLERDVKARAADLHESEARFRILFEEAPDACFLIGLDGRFIDGNKSMERMVDYRREELVGQNLFESGLFHDNCFSMVAGSMLTLAEGRKVAPCELVLRRRDGSRVYVEVSGQAIRLQGERVVFFSAHDLTGHKETERKLAESEARFRLLFEEAPDACFLIDLDGRFVDGNKAVERQIGYSREELRGQSVFESAIFPPIAKQMAAERIGKLGRNEKVTPIEYVLQRKDGSEIQVEVTSMPILLQGKTVLLSTARDLSARKKTEQALQESEEKYRLLFESETDAVMLFDGETRQFIDVNDAAVQSYGYTREEFLKLTHFDITAEPEVANQVIRENLAGRPPSSVRSSHRRKDGTVFPVEIAGSSFSIKGRPVVCGVVRDITGRVKHEEEQQRSQKELRHLASELSLAEQRERQRIAAELHDGICQLLSSSNIRLAALREADGLSRATVQSIDKVSGIIEESLKQTRSLIFELSCPMLTELGLAAALEDLCSSMAHEYSARFEFRGEQRPLPLAMERKILLYRSARELLINVARHSEAEWACVELEREGGLVRLRVEDNGKGFDATSAGMGFSVSGGFGLFNLSEYLRHAGGEVLIDSGPGNGTRVTLSLPLEEQHG